MTLGRSVDSYGLSFIGSAQKRLTRTRPATGGARRGGCPVDLHVCSAAVTRGACYLHRIVRSGGICHSSPLTRIPLQSFTSITFRLLVWPDIRVAFGPHAAPSIAFAASATSASERFV